MEILNIASRISGLFFSGFVIGWILCLFYLRGPKTVRQAGPAGTQMARRKNEKDREQMLKEMMPGLSEEKDSTPTEKQTDRETPMDRSRLREQIDHDAEIGDILN